MHIPAAWRAMSSVAPLKIDDAIPVLVRPAFWRAFPLPQRMSTFTPALILRLVPELVGSVVRPTCLFPEQESAFANNLIQTLLGLCQDSEWIWVRLEGSTAADMHAGVQGLELFVRHYLGVSCGFQRLLLEGLVAPLGGSITGRDRKRVQKSLSGFYVY